MNTEAEKKDIENNSDVAAFSYFLILSWVILYTRKDSPYIQFHARQASILFIFAIFIALLPDKLSFLNLITLGLAVAGFFQANLGKWWKMPVVSHVIESGISTDMVWQWMRRFARTLQASFHAIGSVRKDTDAKPLAQSKTKTESGDGGDLKSIVSKQETFINLQMEKIDFLEQELLIEKYLNEAKLNTFTSEYQMAVEDLTSALAAILECKVTSNPNSRCIILNGKNDKNVFVGGFASEACMIFVSQPIADADQVFGRYHGLYCNLANKNDIDKVITIIKKSLI